MIIRVTCLLKNHSSRSTRKSKNKWDQQRKWRKRKAGQLGKIFLMCKLPNQMEMMKKMNLLEEIQKNTKSDQMLFKTILKRFIELKMIKEFKLWWRNMTSLKMKMMPMNTLEKNWKENQKGKFQFRMTLTKKIEDFVLKYIKWTVLWRKKMSWF